MFVNPTGARTRLLRYGPNPKFEGEDGKENMHCALNHSLEIGSSPSGRGLTGLSARFSRH